MITLAERLDLDAEAVRTVDSILSVDAEAVHVGRMSTRDRVSRLSQLDLAWWGLAEDHGSDLGRHAGVISRLAAGCVATAFSLWSHRMAVEYLTRFGGSELDPVRRLLLRGDLAGSTAMAPAIFALQGHRSLVAELSAGQTGWYLQGTIPWASNLFDEGFIAVLPASGSDGNRPVVVSHAAVGVERSPGPTLLALNATRSGSVRLIDSPVPDGWVLDVDLFVFLAAVKPTFVRLQSALAVGLAEAALLDAIERIDGPAIALKSRQHELVERHDAVAGALVTQLAEGASIESITRTRLAAARLAADAVSHELAVAGGSAYLAGSATGRRLAEAAFLPIQSPTEAQLEWELSL